MILPQLIVPLLIAAATPVADAPAPAKLEFPLGGGYRINALNSAAAGLPYFTMYLPVPGKSLWPRVEVTNYLPYINDPKDKLVLDVSKFYTHRGDTVLFERARSPTELQVEFTSDHGQPGGKEHSYERMFTVQGHSYEVRATAPDALWPEVAAKLKACVESFELSPEPAPGKVAFPLQGFRISPLDGADPASTHQRLLSMPGGVTVSVEPYTKTLKEYQPGRKPDWMLDAKDKIVILAENSPAENVLVTEYAEVLYAADKEHPQSIEVKTYEKVVLAHGQLYRATGDLSQPYGELKDVAPEMAAQIKACVDSLEVMPIPAPTATLAPAK